MQMTIESFFHSLDIFQLERKRELIRGRQLKVLLTIGSPRILICLAPFCFVAAEGATVDFLIGVVPLGFSSWSSFSSLFPMARFFRLSVLASCEVFLADF